jgi:predicted acylesterase/phospholipase RssA
MSNKIFLKPTEIEYIALEGGGGKGFAFLGAIDALNDKDLTFNWDKIKGYSGASAGAITAMLLSIGYTKKEDIEGFMKEKIKPETFFDAANPRYKPYPGGFIEVTGQISRVETISGLPKLILLHLLKDILLTKNVYDTSRNKVKETFNDIVKNVLFTLFSLGNLQQILGGDFKLLPDISRWLDDNFSNRQVDDIIDKGLDQSIASIVKIIDKIIEIEGSLPFKIAQIDKAFDYIYDDMGLFACKPARDEFDAVIAKAMKQSRKNITFKEHFHFFKKKLVFTGTNLTIGKTVLFSVDTTPDFPIADAARISMSLPYIFKPYVIKEQKKGYPPCGTYVDGGVWNNLPIHVFDDEISQSQSAAQISLSSQPLAQTLGIRLEFTEVSPVSNLYQFLKKMLNFGLMGTGETQVLERDEFRTILLDTDPLDLLDFTPPKDDTVFKRSRRTVRNYFNLPIETKDKDDADDKASEERRVKKYNPCAA